MKITCGDLNVKVGQEDMVTAEKGRHGLGQKNASGEKLINFCKEALEFEFEFITICIVQNVQTYLNALNSNKT